MEVQVLISAFNKTLKELINFMSKKYPIDRDIAYTSSQIELAMMASHRLTLINFMDGVTPFIPEIKRRDEHFFLKKATTEEDLSSLNLSEKWPLLNEQDKEYLWKSVEKLVTIGEKVMNT